ncbi:putative bifunctional diguanylate cyclase/phosphodiesterase [Turneriella parva]|uniref:Diguanylate cyclase/phosphodiesterase with GAF sensor n=1 Tax=Turneriella parva (strain ATCC BAA-1111 / DSM 21527 / NCTC 11395 / H) TaxID=869212 RepID=I4B491_TURPD|nr:GGDEF and EAL domain-containing protein [Turneriella parva]AFM12098.1 diguanylate cyclase/phosphodiesterase with GAF sensor [Turneriella parva DSM 21527]
MPFQPANLTTLAARHQRLMQIRYGEESHGLGTEQKLQRILQYCAEELDVARVAIWRFNAAADTIVHTMQHERGRYHDKIGSELRAEEFPRYFTALNQDRIINANDAYADARTAEFVEQYLKPLHIRALLDAPVFAGGKLAGVLCIEVEEHVREWSLLDISFAAAAADSVSAINEQNLWEEERRYNGFLEQFDSLTGLINRRGFQQHVFRDIASEPEARHVLALLGLDAFTAVNDKYGQFVANNSLKLLGERALRVCAQHGSLSGRITGDTLGFWLAHPKDQAQVDRFLDDIRAIVATPVVTEYGISISIGGTTGVYVHAAGERAAPDPILAAEIVLKNTKRENKGGVGFFTESGYRLLQDKTRMIDDIQSALAKGQFSAWYQPIFDARTKLYIGVEALVRWHHPDFGLLAPARFLPLVVESGKSRVLGQFMLAQACQDAASLLGEGLDVGRVSVNLSADQLYDLQLVPDIAQLLAKNSLPGANLELEVIEELIGGNFDLVHAQLTRLREAGIGISVDDFGTGYSSLSRLKLLPVQKIKIDKSFIDGLPHSGNDASIVRSIIALGRALQLELVAEGVETAEQSAWLEREGVDYLQGFFYAKPLSAEGLREFLRKRVA